jgi:hypothetical protein
MTRNVIVLIGLSLFLGFLFPIAAWIKKPAQEGLLTTIYFFFIVTPSWSLFPTLVALLVCLFPAFALLHYAKAWHRIPQSDFWVSLLGVSCLLYLVLQTGLAFDASIYFGRTWQLTGVSIWNTVEAAIKAAVLVSLVGVLTNLRAPEPAPPAKEVT